MKKLKGNKTAALLGAIAMVMIAVVSIVGVTFAWFTASPDPRVMDIRAEVKGADTLLISHNGTDGSFKRTVAWGEITGANGHASSTVEGELSSVTPKVDFDNNNAFVLTGGVLNFAEEGMVFSNAFFDKWFTDNEDTRDAVLGEVFATALEARDTARGLNINYALAGWQDNAENKAILTWYDYAPNLAPGNQSGNWFYFPLFFRSLTGTTDIYLELPSAENINTGIDGTYVNTEDHNASDARKLVSQSIRFAFVQGTNVTVYQPRTANLATANDNFYIGDLLGERGGGNIVPNLYTFVTWEDGVTNIEGSAGRRLIHIGVADEFDGTTTISAEETTAEIGIYIWIDGNDIYNTSFVANSIFEAQIQFFGIRQPEDTTP